MPSIGRALIIFSDGSRMLAELAREPEPHDQILIVHKPLGVPKPKEAPAEPAPLFESLANHVDVLRTAGAQKEIYINIAHVLAVKLIEEKAMFGPSSADMEELFK